MKKARILLFLYSLIIFSISTLTHADEIKSPQNPKSPEEPSVEEKSSEKVKKTQKLYGFSGSIVLKKGSKTKGNILLETDSVLIQNEKDGFEFKKKLNFSEVKSIYIKKWEKKKSGKEVKPYIPYTFYPCEYEIELKSGAKITYKSRIKELEKFVISNEWGEATVFSIFVDYWVKDDKKSTWYNAKKDDFDYNDKNPNPKSIIEIHFDDAEAFTVDVDK